MPTAATAPAGPAFTAGEAAPRRGLAAMTLLPLGVVYGDIGASLLHTVKEILAPALGVPRHRTPW